MGQFPKFDFSAFERKLSIKSQSKTLDGLGDLISNIIDFTSYSKFLNKEEKMEIEERAAIMEYDGGLSRSEAEKNTLNNIIYLRDYKNGQ